MAYKLIKNNPDISRPNFHLYTKRKPYLSKNPGLKIADPLYFDDINLSWNGGIDVYNENVKHRGNYALPLDKIAY